MKKQLNNTTNIEELHINLRFGYWRCVGFLAQMHNTALKLNLKTK